MGQLEARLDHAVLSQLRGSDGMGEGLQRVVPCPVDKAVKSLVEREVNWASSLDFECIASDSLLAKLMQIVSWRSAGPDR